MENKLLVLKKFEDFYLELMPQLWRLPKNEKYTMGSRIETFCLDIVEALITANYHPEIRSNQIQIARTKIQTVQWLIRIMNKQNLLCNKKYESLSLQIVEIGKMLTKWYQSAHKV